MLKEAMYINKSLSFLEQAILALADRRRDFVPFRQTKLTHALKDTLGETGPASGFEQRQQIIFGYLMVIFSLL